MQYMRNAMSLSQLIYEACVCVRGECVSVLFTCNLLKSKSFLLCHVASVWLGFRPSLVCSCPGNWPMAILHTPLAAAQSHCPTPTPPRPCVKDPSVRTSRLYTWLYIQEQCVSAHKTKQNHLSIMKQEGNK